MLVRRQDSRQIEAVGIPTGNGEERIVFFESTEKLGEKREEIRRKKLILFQDEGRSGGAEEREAGVDGGEGEGR